MKIRLNEKYANDFLTLTNGLIFYKKNNSLNKQETLLDIKESNNELTNLLEQGVLELVDDTVDKMEEKIKVIKENIPKNKINTSLKTEEVTSEVNNDSEESE